MSKKRKKESLTKTPTDKRPLNNKRLNKERSKKNRLILLIGILLILAALLYFAYDNLIRVRFGVIPEDILIEIPASELPEDTLYITSNRKQYGRGEMTLIIPAIEVDTTVGESTTPEGLKEMPGLYEFAQLPGEGNVNTSIAGHRDIHDKVFYSLDKVSGGDYLYLLYDGNIYRYMYKDTKIVEPNDWDVIKPQGFSCLTLTTCDPIGTSLNRMVLRAELIDYQPLDDNYQFIKSSLS